MGMAAEATEHRVVGAVRMTVCTGCPFSLVNAGIDRECIMRIDAAAERCGRMTGLARSGKSGRHMIGIRHRIELSAVTRIAVARCTGVPASNVAIRASGGCMRACEWESRGVVVERGALPANGAVTYLTVLRKSSSPVVRICRGVELVDVTTCAGRA